MANPKEYKSEFVKDDIDTTFRPELIYGVNAPQINQDISIET